MQATVDTRRPTPVPTMSRPLEHAPDFPHVELEADLPEGRLLLDTDWRATSSFTVAISEGRLDKETADDSQTMESPSGEYVASYEGSSSYHFTRPAGSVTVRDRDGAAVATIPERVRILGWSPAGSKLAYSIVNNPGIGILDVSADETRYTAIEDFNWAWWSPDNAYLLLDGEESVLDVRTGELRRLTGYPGNHGIPDFSPNGRFLPFIASAPPGAPWEPGIYDMATGQSCSVAPNDRYAMKMSSQGGPGLTWSPDSTLVAVTDESGSALGASYTRVDVADPLTCSVQTIARGVVGFEWTGDGRRLVLSVLRDIKDWYTDAGKADLYTWSSEDGLQALGVAGAWPTWTPGGHAIVAIDGEMLRVVDARTSTFGELPLGRQVRSWAFSPSGRYLALTIQGESATRISIIELGAMQEITLADIPTGYSDHVYIAEWLP
jgi:Tol biopolymer transport system component